MDRVEIIYLLPYAGSLLLSLGVLIYAWRHRNARGVSAYSWYALGQTLWILGFVIEHHEHWDGSGYPQGLKGEEIPLGARIFSAIDVWDAVQSERPYNQPWSMEKAIQYLKEESGKLFDPLCVTVFLDLVARGKI